MKIADGASKLITGRNVCLNNELDELLGKQNVFTSELRLLKNTSATVRTTPWKK